jgi:hypothetical protein
MPDRDIGRLAVLSYFDLSRSRGRSREIEPGTTHPAVGRDPGEYVPARSARRAT